MKIAILTNEYPPNVYGGAGVHVEYLTKELARADGGRHSVKVLCFGKQNITKGNLSVKGIDTGYKFAAKDPRHNKFLDTVFRDTVMSGELNEADVIHCHTWYSHFAGLLAKQLLRAPLVLTTHSLEPHRPWKAEQLGSAYFGSSWIERTAYENADGIVAVSKSMKEDVQCLYGVDPKKVRVIHNGIDVDEFKFTRDEKALLKHGVDKNIPYILFVGRITRQKGIIHLMNAIKYLTPGSQVVLCASSPDTKEIGEEMRKRFEEARKASLNKIIWISEMTPKKDLIALYSQASVFVCPSVYEPFGIINLEAMACETPVVASAVGGIPEIIVNGKTGALVPFKRKSAENAEPADPKKFALDLAAAVNSVLGSKAKMKQMGLESRKRAVEHFSWKSIAAKTLDFYRAILKNRMS